MDITPVEIDNREEALVQRTTQIKSINRTDRINQEMMRFDITKPSLFRWILIIGIALILNIEWLNATGGFGIVISFCVIIIASWLWSKIGFMILSKTVIREFNEFNLQFGEKYSETYQKIGRSNPILRVFGTIILRFSGFRLSKYNEYYLEAEVKDVEIGKFKDFFRLRLLDVVSSCLGLSLLIGVSLRYLLEYINKTFFIGFTSLDLIVFLFYSIAMSPLFVFWLIPVIWVFEDAQLRTVDIDRGVDSDEMIIKVRRGLLSKLLGWGGLLTGLIYLADLSTTLYGPDVSIVFKYSWALFILIWFLLTVTGTAYLTTVIYLARFHERNVNEFRRLLSKIIPVGVTVVKLEKLAGETHEMPYYPKKQKFSSVTSPQILCLICGFQNALSFTFCGNCGEELIVTTPQMKFCLKCGTRRTPSHKFCEKCGNRFD